MSSNFSELDDRLLPSAVICSGNAQVTIADVSMAVVTSGMEMCGLPMRRTRRSQEPHVPACFTLHLSAQHTLKPIWPCGNPFPWMMINALGNVIGLTGWEGRPKLQPGLLLKVLKPRPVHESQTEASGRAPCSQVPGQMEPSCFPPRPGAWHLALRGSKRGTVAVHVGFSDSGLLGPRLRRGRVRASDNS